MKTINKLYIILACVLGAAVSCTDDFTYTPAVPEDSSKVYVTWDASTVRNLQVDGAELEVVLQRTSTSGTLPVSLEIDDPSGIFSLKESSVTFADGSNTASVYVNYDYDELVINTEYTVELSISDESLVSQYGVLTMPLAITKAWRNLGMAQFYDDWFFGYVWEKELRQSPDGSPLYRIMNPYTKADVEADGFGFVSELPYIEFTIEEDGSVSYSNLISLGFTFSDMPCYYADPYWLRKDEASKAANGLIADGLVQFVWYPILNYDSSAGSYSWWGSPGVAYLSFPGGIDLNDALGL